MQMSETKKSANVSSVDTVFTVVAQEASEFYKLITTIASAFLGGVLVFVEKITPKPSHSSIIVLGIGGALLVLSIGAIAYVRIKNLVSARCLLDGNLDEATRLDHKKEVMSHVSVWLLMAGMACITLFAAMNLWEKGNKSDGRTTLQENGHYVAGGVHRVNPVRKPANSGRHSASPSTSH
jgi:hypothetical protein